MKLLLAGVLAAGTLLGAAPAHADQLGSGAADAPSMRLVPLDPFQPPCDITPEQSCSSNGTPPGQLRVCPETGGWTSEFGPQCPSLWVGPYLPGNPSTGGGGDR